LLWTVWQPPSEQHALPAQQPPAQVTVPDGQPPETQVPFEQTVPLGQEVPQAPQLAPLVFVFTQFRLLVQSVWPGGQVDEEL
jgi:hypothetical protein